MEEKGSIKISLGTLICICIIIVLVFALGIMYYFGFVKDNRDVNSTIEKNAIINIANDENIIKENVVKNEDKEENSVQTPLLQLGKKYLWNEIVEGYNGETSKNEVTIVFKENNIFEEKTANAFSEGGEYKGTYKVEGDKIVLITTKQNVYDGWQDYEDDNEFTYIIISNTKIKNPITGTILEIVD